MRGIVNLKFCIFFILLVFVNKPDSGHSRDFEVSTGGVFSQFVYTRFINCYEKIGQYESENNKVIISQGFDFSVSFSYLYYPYDKFGFGFKIQNGFAVFFPDLFIVNGSSDMIKFGFGLDNKILFLNKFGNYKDKTFLLEYGITSLLCVFGTISLVEFYLGPEIFLGFEKRTKKAFSYTVGGFIDANFKVWPLSITYTRDLSDIYKNRYLEEAKTVIDRYNFSFSFGIEFRLKYSYMPID